MCPVFLWHLCSLYALILVDSSTHMRYQMYHQFQQTLYLYSLNFFTCHQISILFSQSTNSVNHQYKFHAAESQQTDATYHSPLFTNLLQNDLAYLHTSFNVTDMYGTKLLRGFLIPIINTTFIESSTATYLRNSFFRRLILRLNFLTFLKNNRIHSLPTIYILALRVYYTSPRNDILPKNLWRVITL